MSVKSAATSGNSKRRDETSLPATGGGRIRDCELIYLSVLEGGIRCEGEGKKVIWYSLIVLG